MTTVLKWIEWLDCEEPWPGSMVFATMWLQLSHMQVAHIARIWNES